MFNTRLFIAAAATWAVAAIALGASVAGAQTYTATPYEVAFPSMDGTTQLNGFVWRPEGDGPFPAVVMMHGCGGAYRGGMTAAAPKVPNIHRQFREWGDMLVANGYAAVLVDSFGSRGHWNGVCSIPWSQRTGTGLDEVRRRPLDAFGGLKHLKDYALTYRIATDRVGLVGWSNGASAVMSVVAETGPQVWHANVLSSFPGLVGGFKAAVAEYPGCGLAGAYNSTYFAMVPLELYVGTADETTPPASCYSRQQTHNWFATARNLPKTYNITAFEGAEHSFDLYAGTPRDTARAGALALFAAKLKQ
ncbi:MAG TPA: hypothetical protein VED40_04000 [Azospirillaceae bacterium]|nr:hypothetical protein [Azospirillaceae bacterium]